MTALEIRDSGEPAEFGKNRTVSTSDMGQALVQPGLCPIEVHLNTASGCSPAPCQTRMVSVFPDGSPPTSMTST
ncbi:hypothetical protein ALQ48_200006 [Pseudomonas coronafaciens pv. zizaniae]|nr:hypothetical protein ALQ48_200006 [Pseudomonas coronafaciens pv. zizaniae]